MPEETIQISREKLISFVSHTFSGTNGGREDDEHPLPPGPWDPIIRKVAGRLGKPTPEPWRDALGAGMPWRTEFTASQILLGLIAGRRPEIFDAIGEGRFDIAALNPQPLPPRAAFLAAFAEEVIDRALLMQEIADAMSHQGDERGIIIVSGKLQLLVDELCGNNFKVKIPLPKPKRDESELLSGLELLTVSAVFQQNAAMVAHEGVRQELKNAGARLAEAGIARM